MGGFHTFLLTTKGRVAASLSSKLQGRTKSRITGENVGGRQGLDRGRSDDGFRCSGTAVFQITTAGSGRMEGREMELWIGELTKEKKKSLWRISRGVQNDLWRL